MPRSRAKVVEIVEDDTDQPEYDARELMARPAVNVREAAYLLGCSTETIDKACRGVGYPVLRAIKGGSRVRSFRPSDLGAWMEARAAMDEVSA